MKSCKKTKNWFTPSSLYLLILYVYHTALLALYKICIHVYITPVGVNQYLHVIS